MQLIMQHTYYARQFGLSLIWTGAIIFCADSSARAPQILCHIHSVLIPVDVHVATTYIVCDLTLTCVVAE